MIFNDMNLVVGIPLGEVIVTITGRSTSVSYDGESHSVNGYNVSISDPSYTVNDFTFSGTATASRTNVGTTNIGLTASQFSNTNPRYRNVVFVVTDGYVKITRKTVTVTAEAKSKTYDNDPNTDPVFTANVSGLIGTDTITYSISCTHTQNVLYTNGILNGYTIVPIEVYLNNGLVKVKVALAKGKKLYDKRADIQKKDMKREAERDFKIRNLG